ncbi:hypothetical protein AB0383_20535 [Amycolatopsis sp. NPDC051373]|uniref:hypothetical protein n=1 Tax=Amycolatopsis sp. NPDC051373 TaxID=3155801 RepID=UPI00344EF496
MSDDFYTPDGKRAWYTKTIFGTRQHLTLDGLFPDETACGHPASGSWSNLPIRTSIGMTCRWCIRRVTKHGSHGRAPMAYPWLLVAMVAKRWQRIRPPKPSPEPETFSTDELF